MFLVAFLYKFKKINSKSYFTLQIVVFFLQIGVVHSGAQKNIIKY